MNKNTNLILFLTLVPLLVLAVLGCEKPVKEGCTDSLSYSYDSDAELDDGSCEYYYGGKDYGQLDIGSERDLDNEYNIYVNGEYVGRSTGYFPGGLSCGEPKAVGLILPAGRHTVRAVGNGGTEIREGVVDVDPQKCEVALIEYMQLQDSYGDGGTGDGGSGDGDSGGDYSTGSLVVWTNKDHGCGKLKVYVNDTYKGDVTGYYTSGTPDCGSAYCVTVPDLAPGSYEIYAECEDGSGGWFPDNLSVYENGCSNYLLN